MKNIQSQRAFLRDVIIPSKVTPIKGICPKALLAYPKACNVEYLTELSIEKVGNLTYVDEAGFDFSDYSDCKTSTLQPQAKADILSLEAKKGAIRALIYNPFEDRIDFFFFPYEDWRNIAQTYGKCKTKLRIRSSYSKKTGLYKTFEPFRVNSFEELAKAR